MSEIDNLTIEQKQDILNKILKERERHRINYRKRVEQGITYSKKNGSETDSEKQRRKKINGKTPEELIADKMAAIEKQRKPALDRYYRLRQEKIDAGGIIKSVGRPKQILPNMLEKAI